MACWVTLSDERLQRAMAGATRRDRLRPGKFHSGSVVDGLRGPRSLALDTDRTSWRSCGAAEHFGGGVYATAEFLGTII